MIYLVDNTIDGKGASPIEIKSALNRIRPELEVVTESFHQVTRQRIQSLDPTHIFLSGQSHPWDMYSADSLAGVYDIIRDPVRPVLGVCGGHQQMAIALGAPVGLMERIGPGEGYEGARRERGFFSVATAGAGLFEGLPDQPVFWHSHCDEVKELPADFKCTASNSTCAIQAMEHESKPLFGVQFHPELFDESHPAGQTVIENFLKI
ncbi:MAG TPA: gamma-glutamyl-gamma-aminobutyrate hydrolase family protein [Pyrinomonadaceae bacterium]|jgi:GMP synthase (glutamine-hydrolysing)|nr:gamma-glutamyl-gamma-aminobutyrate hydrolase family protein [Pyrinomonadaceae bacterium]